MQKRIMLVLITIYTIFLFLFFSKIILLVRFAYIFPFLIPYALLTKRGVKGFIRDWAPFYIVLFLYDQFRLVQSQLLKAVNKDALIVMERFVFGNTLPTIWLQNNYSSLGVGLFGAVLTIFYLGHYVLPVLFFFFLWVKKPASFSSALFTFMILNIIAFLTFLLFPAYPPWIASAEGLIPHLTKLLDTNLQSLFGSGFAMRTYGAWRANQLAPFPSLHAADPFLLFLLSISVLKKKFVVLFLVNAIVVAWTIVFFGEHYVVDIIAGWLYALVTYTGVRAGLAQWRKRGATTRK